MKVKHIIVVFILGAIFIMLGALFKIQHWPGAAKLLIGGLAFQIVGLVMIIWKILTTDKYREFLDL
ncbi:MAG: hypothetical protein JSV24_02855 [Bacteroidales bacterium]|nr:MAG: hypothetical protein JSV24_02855 [Bacteroidales bacterium]